MADRPAAHDAAAAEIGRMAALFETEALGEARWLAAVSGAAATVTRAQAALALERAAINLRSRK